MKLGVNVKINPEFEKALEKELIEAMALTMEDFRADLERSQTMPFDNGDMQKSVHGKVEHDGKNIVGFLITDTPYARFQYHGKLMIDPNTGSSYAKKGVKKVYTNIPLKYQTANNPLARSEWLEPYLDGEWLNERFNENLRNVRGGK